MGVLNERMPGAELAGARRAATAGDWQQALAACESVLEIHPRHVDALAARGAVLRAMGQPREALESLLEAMAAEPRHAVARQELALALRDCGRLDEARTLYALLLRDAGAPGALWHDLGIFLLAEGKPAMAETCLRRAVAMAPERPRFRQSLADLLAVRGQPAAARDLYLDILSLAPESAEAHAGLGQALIALGRLDEAEDRLERALALDSGLVSARLGRARMNLLSGNWRAAWEDLDWRWAQAGRTRPEPPGATWDGNTDLTGETILLWAERGLADTIHLLRFVPKVAARGARVVLGLPASLAPLAEGMPGIERVIPSGSPLPADIEVDFNASLADLPRLLDMSLDNLPPAPFLRAPAGRRPRVEAPATALLKVGLVWAGAQAAASIPLPQLMPLLGVSGIAAFGLQLGQPARAMAEISHPALITDLSATISDYADLAGRMAEMDVIIAVDSPAAHLAGAMGLPVWVVLPKAPDWHWLLDRADSPLYPTARLFRQTRADNWNAPIQQLCATLREKMAEEATRRQDAAKAVSGPQAALGAFLAAHLRSGDLFVDAGAGSGALAQEAAAHPCGGVTVLAVDARAGALPASMPDNIRRVVSALAESERPAVISARPRTGTVVFTLPEWVRSGTRTTTLDAVLDDHPEVAVRRLILHLGARGCEAAMLAGLSRQPAVVLFEHRPGGTAARELVRRGYELFRFPGSAAVGPVVPLHDEAGAVLALAPGEAPAPLYGDTSRPDSPASIAQASLRAARLAAEGTQALVAGKPTEAGALFAQALAADPGNTQANANLGSLLRRIGRADAAAACWARALDGGADAAVRANLANVLRELGHWDAASGAFKHVLALEPGNPRFLYAFGLLERERGNAKAAVELFERAEQMTPGTVPRQELAAALLKSGNLARGMAEMAFRPPSPHPQVDAPSWDGGRLEARTILVRDEADARDTLMLARFIPQVARQGGLVVVECQPEAARLLAGLPGVERVVPRGQELPAVDLTVDLLDVPRLIGTTSRTTPLRDVPYLRLPEDTPSHAFPDDRQFRVGVAWEAPFVPAEVLLGLAAIPGVTLVSLQRDAGLDHLGASCFVEDLGQHSGDLAEDAALIAGLDLVICADTVHLHLAGAMGKPAWVLLPRPTHWRWVDGRDDSVWYPTVRVFRADEDGRWTQPMARIAEALAAMAAGKARG